MFTERQQKRPRPSYACMECTRRKLRCSKHIPCSACVERGLTQLCRRRTEDATRAPLPSADRTGRPSPDSRPRVSSASTLWSEASGNHLINSLSEHIPALGDRPRVEQSSSGPSCAAPSPMHLPQSRPAHRKIVDNVSENAAVMLEFLALSRQSVLQIAEVGRSQSPPRNETVVETFDPVLTADQVRAMMLYHQECISWIHNVVHLPTFRDQCEQLFIDTAALQGGWLAVYYAMIAVCFFGCSIPPLASLTMRILRSLYTTQTPLYCMSSILIRLVSYRLYLVEHGS